MIFCCPYNNQCGRQQHQQRRRECGHAKAIQQDATDYAAARDCHVPDSDQH